MLMVVSLVSGMIFSRKLTINDYGTYLQTFLAYDFAVPILTLGLPSALFYFLPRSKERQKGIVLDNILLLLFAAVIFSIFLIGGGTELLAKRFNNPDLSITLRWMTFYPLYTFPVLMASAVWVSKEKVKLNALYNVFTGLLLAISLIVSVLMTRSYSAPIMVRIILPLIYLPITLYLIFKYVPGDWNKPNLISMWQMAKFAIPLGLATVIGTLTNQLSSLIVSLMTTTQEYAIYATGAKEVPFIGLITGSISVVIMAEMSQYCKEKDFGAALDLFRKSAVMSASFLLPLMVFLFLFADSFIEVLYSKKYLESSLPFRIYLLYLPVRIIFYGPALIALGRSKAILYRTLVDFLITGILSYFLVWKFGAFGAAAAPIISAFAWGIPYNINSISKGFKCKSHSLIPFVRLGHIMLISLIAGSISACILYFKAPSFLILLLGSSIFFFIYCLLSYRYIPEFRELIIPYINKINAIKHK